MKFKYSISLKLTLIVVILSTIIIGLLFHISLQQEREALEKTSHEATRDFAISHSVITKLDRNLNEFENLNNIQLIYELIDNITSNNTRVKKINIVTPVNDSLYVTISTDKKFNNFTCNPYSIKTYEEGHTYYILDEKEPLLTIISPINISNEIVGTYELVFSMYSPESEYNQHVNITILLTLLGIFILIFSLLYLLRRIIVKPITTFRKTANIIGKGNLDTKIDIKSSDEIGDLASAFNQMAKDLRESRDKIQRYNRILENLLDQKDAFIGQLGHDLKNPLTPLVGLLPIIQEKVKDPELKRHLNIINQNVEYMRDLIFKTLELAKLRSSDIKFDFENLDLKEQVEQVISSQKMFLQENKIDIENKIQTGIIVRADKLRLAEVFNNLITNAVKYTSSSGGKIIINAEDENDFILASVRDSGIGMTKEQQKQIFDDFYRADQSTKSDDSIGLGLSICKRIIEKHGGKIWVESPGKNKGSIFFFTLKKGEKIDK